MQLLRTWSSFHNYVPIFFCCSIYGFADLVETIETVLPLLTQIQSPELYSLPLPSSATNHTPHSTTQDHTASYRMAKATMDAIEKCRKEVPGHLEANQTCWVAQWGRVEQKWWPVVLSQHWVTTTLNNIRKTRYSVGVQWGSILHPWSK